MSIVTVDYSNINYDEIAKIIGINAKHVPMLITMFLGEVPSTLDSLGEAIAQKDYMKIKLSSHSIKGSAGNLRFSEVYEMAKEMEHAATAQNEDFEYLLYFEAIKQAIATIEKKV
jgi:HPt (histidine-containing phosphotransfer) domain-containing protein